MVDIREQSPLSLAFVGDAVYSLIVREHFVTSKRYNINTLNKLTVKYVSAKGQFAALKILEDILTEEEKAVVKRGQNASKATVAKHATAEEYRRSTGFEALIGYLELTEQKERINFITNYILENLTFEDNK